jgi:hypothetical protein
MRARRLAGPDKLDVDVEHTLRAWTQPEILIIVRAAEIADNRQVRYRATIADGLGVFSEQADGEIRFARVRPDHLVDMAVGMLPPYGPLPAREVTITHGPSSRPADRAGDFDGEDFVTDPGAPPRSQRRSDTEAMARFAGWQPHRHGTFELSMRPGRGSLHPVGTVLFADTDGGRFLTFTEPLGGGETRLRLVPSDGSHLRRWLHESIAEARR